MAELATLTNVKNDWRIHPIIQFRSKMSRSLPQPALNPSTTFHENQSSIFFHSPADNQTEEIAQRTKIAKTGKHETGLRILKSSMINDRALLFVHINLNILLFVRPFIWKINHRMILAPCSLRTFGSLSIHKCHYKRWSFLSTWKQLWHQNTELENYRNAFRTLISIISKNWYKSNQTKKII